MTEVKDHEIADSGEFTKANIPNDVSSHIEETPNHEQQVVEELKGIGEAAGHTALATHDTRSPVNNQTNGNQAPDTLPVENANRWSKFFNIFQGLKKGK